jgi:hypothetical protein
MNHPAMQPTAIRLFRAENHALLPFFARVGLIVAGLLLLGVPSYGQGDSLVRRLPPDAWLYVHWHGTGSLSSVRNTNSVLRLWSDPSVVASRQRIFEQWESKSAQKPPAHPITQADFNDFVSLLENPAVFGVLSNPSSSAAAATNSASTFFILDTTGKLDQFARFRAKLESLNAAHPERIPLVISRVPVTKVISGKQTSYEAETGNYFVHADSLPAMAELLPRLTAASLPASPSEETALPAPCRDVPRNALLDYLALPEKHGVSSSLSDPNFNFPAFLKALHADQIHAICGSLNFEATATRMRGVILGDTSAGSVLNLLGDSRDSFATMKLAPAGAAYQCNILDFGALYSSLKTGFTAALPPERAGLIAGIDSMLAISWGMPPADALQLFTGEIAIIRPHPAADPLQQVYALSIQQPDKVLGLLHKLLTSMNPEEKTEGDTTYLTLPLPAGLTPAAGGPDPRPENFTLAVSPNFLIVSPSGDVAREAVARAHEAGGSASSQGLLREDPSFQKVRAQLPEKLSSLGYTDLAHYNWAKMASNYQKELNEQLQAQSRASGKPAPPAFDFFRDFNWPVIPRYLQYAESGAWKDSSGIYFDSYIQ